MPSTGGTTSHRARPFAIAALAGRGAFAAATAAGLFLLVVFFQRLAGAFDTEFFSDSAAHYVTGLMVSAFLSQDSLGSPIAFAEDFHSHYAFVGLGLWPPLFYAVDGLWFYLFGASRASALVLSALISAALGWTACMLVVNRLGRTLALAVGLFVVLMPLVKAASNDLLLDTSVALLALAAVAAYARYASTLDWRFNLLFAVLAAGCILTKGNGGMLALVPPVHLLISNRWRLLRHWAFWLPVPIVALLVAPWYLLTYKMTSAGFLYEWGLAYTRLAAVENVRTLLDQCGWVAVVLALVGVGAAVLHARRRNDQFWPGVASLLVASLLFQAVVPTALEPRYLVTAAVAIAMLAALGLFESIAWIVRRRTASGTPSAGFATRAPQTGGGQAGSEASHARPSRLVAAVLLVASVPALVAASPSQPLGFSAVAEKVLSLLETRNPTLLVAVGPQGEGALVSAIAMLDPKPASFVPVRGSRLLGGGGYKNGEYEARFTQLTDVERTVRESGVALIALERSASADRWQHNQQLARIVDANPDQYPLVATLPLHGGEARLYRIQANTGVQGPSPVLLDYLKPRKSFAPGAKG